MNYLVGNGKEVSLFRRRNLTIATMHCTLNALTKMSSTAV